MSPEVDRSGTIQSIVTRMDATDRLVMQRFEAFEKLREADKVLADERVAFQEKAVSAAFAAAKEAVQAALSAAKEAVIKAEVSQSTYNTNHNDLARKMESQYKDMLPREEARVMFKSLQDKVDDLRIGRSQTTGVSVGTDALWGRIVTIGGLLVGIAGLAVMAVAMRGHP